MIRFRDTKITYLRYINMSTEIFRWEVGINIILPRTRNIVELDPTTRKRGLSCGKNI